MAKKREKKTVACFSMVNAENVVTPPPFPYFNGWLQH